MMRRTLPAWAVGLTLALVAGLSLAPTTEAVYDYLPDVLTPDRDYEEVAWTHDRETGPHLAVNYDIREQGYEAIARVVDSDGNDLLHAYGNHASLYIYISDGYDEEGEPRYIPVYTGWPGEGRADIKINGSTYVFHHHFADPVEAHLFQDASTGTFGDPSTVLDSGRVAEIHRERVYGPEAWSTTFHGELSNLDGWDMHAPTGEVRIEEDGVGYQRARGRMVIDADTGLEDLTYIHRPSPDAPFIGEASFRPRSMDPAFPGGVPDHQAVLAGVSGPVEDPEVDWAIVMVDGAPNTPRGYAYFPEATAVPGQYGHWSLYFIDEDGTRTQVAPTWCCLDERWHDVRAYVDQEDGTVEVQVDGNATALRFDDAFTGASERIAIGDIWHGDAGMWWTGGRMGYYDNLAVEPAGGTP